MAKKNKSRSKSTSKSRSKKPGTITKYLKSRRKETYTYKKPEVKYDRYSSSRMEDRAPASYDRIQREENAKRFKEAEKKMGLKYQIYDAIEDFSPGQIRNVQRRLGIKNATSKEEGGRILRELIKTTTRTKSKTKTKPKTGTKTKTPKTTQTPYDSQINSLTKSLQEQLDALNKKYAGSTSELSTIQGTLKSQRRAANQAARKAAKASEKQYGRLQSQYAAEAAAAQEQYNQQMALFNADMLAQREAFDQAMFLRDQEAEQYRLEQERRAAEFEEQQRLAMERQFVGAKTFAANQMRAASADPRFRIGVQSPGAETYGTSQFKRRQDLRPTIFQGIQPSATPTIGGINI